MTSVEKYRSAVAQILSVPAVYLSYGIGWAIALFASPDVVSATPILGALISGVSIVVPSLAKWQAYSRFPEITGLFFAFLWCTVPLQVWTFRRTPGMVMFDASKWRDPPYKKIVAPIVLLGVYGSLVLVTLTVAVPDGVNCSWGCVGQSRWSLAFWGSAIVLTCAVALTLLLAPIGHLKSIYLDPQKD